ncbi:MAG: HIT family protein [Flavobacteriaceae bacterium]
MSSLFTKIINGEIPCYKIHESENCFAFLDINPNTLGHTLCIPKKEEDCIFDLDSVLYNELFLFSKDIAKAIKKAIPCKRVSLTVIGLEVPHAHIHLIPIKTMNDANFSKKVICSEEKFKEIALKIKSFL